MLGYLALIFTCQLIGELITGAFALPVPGPVLGMVLLFVILLVRGAVPDPLAQISGVLLQNLSLLFVPAGAGVMLHFKLIGASLWPIGLTLVISTVLTIVVTALVMRGLSQGRADV